MQMYPVPISSLRTVQCDSIYQLSNFRTVKKKTPTQLWSYFFCCHMAQIRWVPKLQIFASAIESCVQAAHYQRFQHNSWELPLDSCTSIGTEVVAVTAAHPEAKIMAHLFSTPLLAYIYSHMHNNGYRSHLNLYLMSKTLHTSHLFW